jgi:EmrB/QacA subfamily drug resistance transporter
MTASSPSPDAPVRLDSRAWGVLLVLCGAIFLDALDVSMVGMTLPSIESDLGLSTANLQWVVSGYIVGYGGFLLLGGRAADLLGRRRMFIIAMSVFLFASLLGGLVNDGTLLIATRFIKGVAAAFTAPAGLSIITTSYPEGPARNKALSIYTATGASGFSLGLVLGGALTTADWRLAFLLPVPIAAAVVAAAVKLIPRDDPNQRVKGSYDAVGAVTVTAAMLALVYGITRAPEAGWGDPSTIGLLALAAALWIVFVAIEKRVRYPLVRLGILRSRTLVGANVAMMGLFGSYVGFQFIATLYMQQLLGWSSLTAALALLPGGLIVAVGSPRVGALVTRVGTAPLLAGGLASLAIGSALFLRIDESPSYAAIFLPTMILLGIGFALAYPAATMAGTSGVADHEQGLASGLVNTSFQIGGALGLAITTAVMTANTGVGESASALLDGFRPGLVVAIVAATLGFLATIALTRPSRTLEPVTSESAG